MTRRARPFGVLGFATGSRYRVTLADVDVQMAVVDLGDLSSPDERGRQVDVAGVRVDDDVEHRGAVLGGGEQRASGDDALGAGEHGAPLGPGGARPRQLEELRLGERRTTVGRVGPAEQRGKCGPVGIGEVVELDDGHLHVHFANVTR